MDTEPLDINEMKTGFIEIETHQLQYFKYEHLPPKLQEISKPFGDLAKQLDELLPMGPEKVKAFDHLLYAKDAAVRASL